MSRTSVFTVCLLAASGVVISCNSDAEKGPEVEACRLLAPAPCAAEARCRVLSATRYEADKVCRHGPQAVGCMDKELLCPQALTFAKDPSGNTWQFQDGCIPNAWQSFEGGEADHAAAEGPVCSELSTCSSLPPGKCAAEAGCRVLSGMRYEVEKVCRHEPAEVGCTDSKQSCSSVLTFAKDPSGNTWVFPSRCIPNTWKPFEGGEADHAAAEGPLCSAAPACSSLPPGQCAAKAECQTLSGIRYEVDKVCRHPKAVVGCMDSHLLCTQAFTYAKDPAGNTWQFPNGCIPNSWQSFAGGKADEAAAEGPLCSAAPACSSLPSGECAATRCQTLSGTRYDLDKACRYGPQVAGCMDQGLACITVMTFAKDPQGNRWVFPSGCIPNSWQTFQETLKNQEIAIEGRPCL